MKSELRMDSHQSTQNNMIDKQTKINDLKEVVKNWIVGIDKTEKLPSNIVALCFNIYEDYGLEMIGST